MTNINNYKNKMNNSFVEGIKNIKGINILLEPAISKNYAGGCGFSGSIY